MDAGCTIAHGVNNGGAMNTIKSAPGRITSLLLCSLLITGCGYQKYQAQPLQLSDGTVSLRTHDTGDAGFQAYMREEGYADLPAQWGWRELLHSSFYFHPDLNVARSQLKIAMAGITTAGQRPNPSISAGAGRRNEPEVPEVYSLGFNIPIETAGKRQARIDMAEALSADSRLNIAQTAWMLRQRLLLSWIEFNAAQQNLAILQQENRLREQIVTMLQQRLEAGMVSSVELSNARLQWQRIQQSLVLEQGRIEELQTQLASNAGLPVDKFRSLSLQSDDTATLMQAQHNIDIANALNPSAQDAALRNRLDIRAGLARYAASEARLRLEIARQYPDISLSPAYNYEEGFHIWSLGINSLLNVMHRNQGQIAEATALRENEAAQFEALQARVIASMDSARSRYRAALQALSQAGELYQTLQQQAILAGQRFELGYADRLELVTQQLESLLAKQNLISAEYQVQRAAAALEDSMQLPLENLGTLPRALSGSEAAQQPTSQLISQLTTALSIPLAIQSPHTQQPLDPQAHAQKTRNPQS